MAPKVKKEVNKEIQVEKSNEENVIQETTIQNKRRNFLPAIAVIILIAILLIVILDLTKQETDKIVAEVNDKQIRLSELNKLYETLPEEYKQTLDKKSLLDKMIESEVIYQEAKKAGIEVSQGEARDYLVIAKAQSGLTEEQFNEKLKNQKINEEDLTREYVKELTIKNFLNDKLLNKIEISDNQIKDYYNKNKAQFKIDQQVTVRHILISDESSSPEKQEEKAASLLKEITKDNFCDYVKQYSTDTASIENCGEYTFTKNDPLVQEFKDLSFKQSPGQIGIVKTQFGTHIIQTIKKTPAKTISLKDAKDKIREALKAEQVQIQYQQFYQELLKNNKIDINLEEIN